MSEIKVNKISPRTACGTTTLGDSGDTFTLPSGGTLTIASGATINNNGTANNFGATGSVNWQTTVKTGDFTEVSGEGYFVNTTSGAVTVTLPSSPAAGAIVGIKDYANTFDTNACTLNRNGSKIGGAEVNGTLSEEGIAITIVFIDSTRGWLVTDSGLTSELPTDLYVTATGGTITTCGNFKIHTFTGPGTFCVSCAGNSAGSNTVSYLVVAGGGAGGGSNRQSRGGSAGGAGGFREGRTSTCSYTVSPLNAPAGLPVSATGYPITVGAGGTGGSGVNGPSSSGANSIFSSITSAGGGSGSSPGGGEHAAGGSGGAGIAGGPAGKAGNTPPVSPPQGNPGGNGGPCAPTFATGGGGGATAAGGNAPSSPVAGAGGAGATTHITGSPVAYAGGGGGSIWGYTTGGTIGAAGTGGGGVGVQGPSNGVAGTANTGGGASGAAGGPSEPPADVTGGNGGSGIVVIRYKFQ